MTAGWFAVRQYPNRVYLISEPCHVNSYLVVGDERALLFDTGLGIGDISQAVRGLTDLPLIVVNSHHHLDHRGGNQHLTAVDFLAHPSGAGLYGAVDPAELGAYAESARSMYATYTALRELDRIKFFLTPDDLTMRPIPDLSSWTIPATEPTGSLDDADVVDLGGRCLTVLHTPGHVPDSICLWEPDTGVLFCGDTLLTTTYWAHLADSDVPTFSASLARLAALDVTTAFVGHNLVADVGPEFVRDVAARFAAVVHDPDIGVVVEGPQGGLVRRVDGNGFAILTAVPDSPPTTL